MPLDFYAAYTAGSTLPGLFTNFQSMSITRGRQWQTDPYSPSSATLVFRGVQTAPIGATVIVTDSEPTIVPQGSVIFIGTVKDTQIQYGIVSNLDYTTIVLEGILARWGRRQFTSRAITQAGTLAQISAVATAIGYDGFTSVIGNGLSTATAQTYVGNGLDLVNLLITTEMGHIAEIGSYTAIPSSPPSLTISPNVTMYPRNYDTTVGLTFADDSTANGIRYDGIEFTSAAQNYYTEATINPQGLSAQTSGSGYYNITQDSLDYNTSQALSHAQYLVAQYNSTSSVPYSITARYSNQNTSTRQGQFNLALRPGNASSGQLINLIFRGTTYPCIIEGIDIAADVSDVVITLTLSSFDNNNYLILNNATFGTLGTSSTYPGNKLGF